MLSESKSSRTSQVHAVQVAGQWEGQLAPLLRKRGVGGF